MGRFKLVIVSLAAVLSVGLALMPVSAVTAQSTTTKDNMEEICNANPDASVCKDWDPSKNPETEVSSTVRNIINVLLFAIGILAIVSIIISGMKFVSSRGDSGAVNKARTQLIYSVVGLVIAVLAFTIVNFVIARLGGGSSGGGTLPAGTTCTGGQTWDGSACICPSTTPTWDGSKCV